LNIAIEGGVIYSNPASALKRAAIRGKEISPPSVDKFNALIAEMRTGHSRDLRNCADFAFGLALTGVRKSEANVLEWRDVDFETGEIVIRGDATTGTKNWELRRVPLIPDAMRSERGDGSLDEKVFRVAECQKALDRACRKSARIASRITICGTYLQRGPLNSAWIFRPFRAGLDTKTVVH
jgi:integrase